MDLHEGDAIEVPSNRIEQLNRTGTIERVLERDPLRIEVRWDDGHRTVFMPAAGNVQVTSRAG